MDRSTRIGLALAWAANLTWGFFPLLFKQLEGVDPAVFIGYRVLYCVPLLVLAVVVLRRAAALLQLWRHPGAVGLLLVSTAMMGLNWGIYLWCILNGRVIEASFGYFLTPILNVVIGVLVFRDSMNPVQWLAVVLAASGVVLMSAATGYVPWFGIALGLSFAVYGAVRKVVRVEALPGTLAENLLLLPPGLLLLWLIPVDGGHGALPQGWIATACMVSLLPIIWYIAAARRISMVTLGNLFYVAPSLSFLLGVFLYHEPFTRDHVVMFGLIWCGLLIYAGDGWYRRQREKTAFGARRYALPNGGVG